MDNKQFIDSVLQNSNDASNKKLRLVQEQKEKDEFQLKRQRTIDLYAEQKCLDLKKKILSITQKGGKEIHLENPGYSINYDGVFLSDHDFIDKYKEFLAQEQRVHNPNVSIQLHKDRIFVYTDLNDQYTVDDNQNGNQNSNQNVNQDNFPNLVLANLLNHQRGVNDKQRQKEQEKLKEAQDTYKVVLDKMLQASKLGLNEIEYSPLYSPPPTPSSGNGNSTGHTFYCNERNFSLHQKWLYESNNNIIVWMRRTNSIFSMQGYHANLCWRQRYFYERIGLYIWNAFFG